MRRVKLENFYVHSSLFAILSLGGAALNYALYPVLTRILSTRDFGDFTAILALSNQILGILLAFNLTSIYLVKKYPEEEARDKAQVIQKILIWFFTAATLLLLIFSPLVKNTLHIASPLSFLILALVLISTVPAVMWMGYLQGRKQLVKVGVFSFVSSLLKFAFAIVLAKIWGVSGGLWGVLIGTIIGLLVLRLIARVSLPHISSALIPFSKQQRSFIRSIRFYILESILVVGMLSVLQNIDITYAKAFFNPTAAGVYSGVSILSNALYYVAFLLVWILLPEVSVTDLKQNRRLLRTAYSLLAALAVGTVVFELLLRNFLAHFLLGKAFGAQGSVLVLASLFQLSLIATTLYAYYLLVLRKRRALLLSSCVFLATVTVPLVFRPHNTHAMITTLLISLLCGWAMYSIINTVRGLLHNDTKEITA